MTTRDIVQTGQNVYFTKLYQDADRLLVWMAIQLRRQIEAMGGDPTEPSRASQELANGNVTVGRQNETLEHRVSERTAQLGQRTSDMNAMLQNMAVGVSTVIPGNLIHPEYSNYLRTIFSVEDVGGKELIPSLFAKSSLGVDEKDQITAALSAILGEDPMMFTINSHLFPREMRVTGDDGRGLAMDKLWEKGLAAGLFSAGERPSRNAVADAIFSAGLSTSAQVTELSGRGVGMDAVRTFLKEQGATCPGRRVRSLSSSDRRPPRPGCPGAGDLLGAR